MANYIICVLLVFLHIVYGTPSIKGLFCQDPDTRKLYPINSTWQSESFCGNYTCKLRKKNVTETEYMPLTKLNVTKNDRKILDDMSTSPSEMSLSVIKNFKTDRQPVYHKETQNDVTANSNELKHDNNDRYLTESEIKTIAEVLRTIKKSDLEAIVEVYNLAQEIYAEMDGSTTEKNVDQLANAIGNVNESNKLKNSKESISYWYEPLHVHNKKLGSVDSKTENTKIVPTYLPARPYPYPPPIPPPMPPPIPPSMPPPVPPSIPTPIPQHFPQHRQVLENDRMKVPYYYPVSEFQRMSSYVHNPFIPKMQYPVTQKPCNKHNNMNYIPWYSQEPSKQPLPLLPYPFSYVHHYNFSYPGNFYYNNYPWSHLDVYNRQKFYPQPYGPYHETPKTKISESVEVKDFDDQNNIQEEIKPIVSDEVLEVPEWQTEPLSTKVINEVKANILGKSKLLKPLSLKKKVKLEKVGKVIKLDDLKRPKRSILSTKKIVADDEEEKYETYIERTTCDTEISTEPGFFRVGNVSQPYPACCPQRITS